MNNYLTLLRLERTSDETLGVLLHEGTILCHTLELPWRDNKRFISCIPLGAYDCVMVKSPKYGEVYELKDVPGRSHVLIHWGNTRANTDGCILLGMSQGYIKGERAVISSKPAVKKLHNSLLRKPFRLRVFNYKEYGNGATVCSPTIDWQAV